MLKDNERGAVKRDTGKPRMGLLPPDVLFSIAKVFTFGAEKYDAWNWTEGFDWSRLYDAAQRHLVAWAGGETHDAETGESHLAHALCCMMMLAAHELRGIGSDDRHFIFGRPKPVPAGERVRLCGVKTPLGLCEQPCHEGWAVCEGHLPESVAPVVPEAPALPGATLGGMPLPVKPIAVEPPERRRAPECYTPGCLCKAAGASKDTHWAPFIEPTPKTKPSAELVMEKPGA